MGMAVDQAGRNPGAPSVVARQVAINVRQRRVGAEPDDAAIGHDDGAIAQRGVLPGFGQQVAVVPDAIGGRRVGNRH